jgi:hypothetical protein
MTPGTPPLAGTIMTKPLLPNLLNWRRDVDGVNVTYHFGNGLEVQTEILMKNDPNRILPLGGPQGTLINHMLNFPRKFAGKDVFEPFAGSGALGLMALKLGARRVDFLDINPRAASFQKHNARRNGFGPERFGAHVEDLATYSPDRRYQAILANPPFVPTPDCVTGTITSNGGPEGNRLVELLLERLEEFLDPVGEAYVYVFQLVKGDGEPVVVDLLERWVLQRPVEITPTQENEIPFDTYLSSYLELFPDSEELIRSWGGGLIERYGKSLGLNHFVLHIGPKGDAPTSVSVVSNVEVKYGEGFLSRHDAKEFAEARIAENRLTLS